MNQRDRDLFNRGVVVGLKLAEEFGAGLEDKTAVPKVSKPVAVKKVKKVKKSKKTKKIVQWESWEEDVLKDNPDTSIEELCKLLPHRSETSIYQRRSKLGIKKQEKQANDGLAQLGQSEE